MAHYLVRGRPKPDRVADLEWERVEEGEGWERVRDLPSLFPELADAAERRPR